MKFLFIFYLRGKEKLFLALALLLATSCGWPVRKEHREAFRPPDYLKHHCQEIIGPPRVERISEHVWLAIGYDLANAVLIHTTVGNIIVDPGMSPATARMIKSAFQAAAPAGPIKAIIYTHSHIDHTGGASVWPEKDTQIWATAAFADHFFKQYGLFFPAEMMRGRRQFGDHVSASDLPCTAIGARVKIGAALENGTLLPTAIFTGVHILKMGNLTLELHAAPGETHDHLFIWIPEDKTLIAGDNFYHAFPNLYSIRGTSPRSVDDWIKSLDSMRAKEPEHLVLSHTKPIHGQKEILQVLTNYRDAIQWLRDEVVRGANKGEDLDHLVEKIKLPPHLATQSYLREFYGQLDWSVKAIYLNYLGWFDGRADQLYPLSATEVAREEVSLLGGPQKVGELAEQAWEKNAWRWAIHWLIKLKKSGAIIEEKEGWWKARLAACYEKLAEQVYNTNGRAYLLETAYELRHGLSPIDMPKLNPKLLDQIPLEVIFQNLSPRLDPRQTMDRHESVYFVFPDENKRFIITIRRGIAEIVKGIPLPGTPPPLATVEMDSHTYRRLALKLLSPISAYANGQIRVEGSWLKFLKFMGYFQK